MDMSNQHYQRAKEFLENRVYEFKGEIVGLTISFKYKIRLLDKRSMIHIGTSYPTQFVGIDIIELGQNGVFLKNMKTFGNTELPYQIRIQIGEDMYKLIVKFFNLADRVIIDANYTILDSLNESIIFESKSMRLETKKISSDIMYLVKRHKNKSEEYRLPEDITGEHFYDFGDGTDISVELEIRENEDLEKPFIVNAEYIDEESQINVLILFNPQEFPNLLSELHYELNETIRHELEHFKQDIKGELPTKKSKSKTNYYTQPHELQAQVAGFKRISRLKKIPFMDVATNWYKTHQYEHGLSKNQINKVLSTIEDYYNSTR
jgi:hypothetical protein